MIVFSRNRNLQGHEILVKIVDNSSRTHRILSKKMGFDSIHLSLKVRTKIMYLSLKYQFLYRKNFDIRDSRLLFRAKMTIFHKIRRICLIIVFSDGDYHL